MPYFFESLLNVKEDAGTYFLSFHALFYFIDDVAVGNVGPGSATQGLCANSGMNLIYTAQQQFMLCVISFQSSKKQYEHQKCNYHFILEQILFPQNWRRKSEAAAAERQNVEQEKQEHPTLVVINLHLNPDFIYFTCRYRNIGF
jgi:hypothetical protein